MNYLDLSIIIVSYNTKEITKACLNTIFASKTNYSFEVIVVDNDSHDGSLDMVKKDFPQVTAIQSGENGGFAKANNLGAKRASGVYVWLLNSDTLIEPTTIQDLLDKAKAKKAMVASCGLRNKDNSLQPQGGALPNLTNIFLWMHNLDGLFARYAHPYQDTVPAHYAKDRTVGWLGGTALLVRRDLYLSMGGLDDHIFMYGEDVDFCYRLNQGNIPIYFFATPHIIHLGQASGSSERAILGEYAGLKYVWGKHFPHWQLPILRLYLKSGALLRTIVYTLTGNTIRRGIYAKAFKLA